MRNKYLISLLFLLSLNLFSCYEDKGSYDYTQIDDVEIKLDKTIYTVPMGDVITAEAELKLKNGSTDLSNMDYKWSVNGETRESWDKQTFEWKTDKGIVNGILVLEVKDRKSGICFYKSAVVNVTGIYDLGLGWMILSEKNNETNVSLLKVTDYGYSDDYNHIIINKAEVLQNVYKKGDGEAAKRPIKLVEHYRSDNNYVGSVLLLQHESAPIDLNGETMEKDLDFNLAFAGGKIPDGEEIVDAHFRVYSDILIGKTGKLYSRLKENKSLFNSGKYLDEPLKLDGEVLEQCTVASSPIARYGAMHLIHDKNKKRFLVMDDYDGTIVPFGANPTNAPADFVPLNNLSDCTIFDIGYSYVRSGYDYLTIFYMVLKKNNKYYYQEFGTNEYGETYSLKAMEILGLTEDPTCINRNTLSGYTFMIAAKNKLYIFDPINPRFGAEKYLEFDSDIVSMGASSYNGCIVSTKKRFFIVDTYEAKNIPLEKRIMYSSPEDLDMGEIKQVTDKFQTKQN